MPADPRRGTAWQDRALCAAIGVDPELFFQDGDRDDGVAAQICRACPVCSACLDQALANEKFGVWGGLSERERQALRRRERRGA